MRGSTVVVRACSRRASELPKGEDAEGEELGSEHFKALEEGSNAVGPQSSEAEELLRPVISSDRDAMERELEMLRLELTSSS